MPRKPGPNNQREWAVSKGFSSNRNQAEVKMSLSMLEALRSKIRLHAAFRQFYSFETLATLRKTLKHLFSVRRCGHSGYSVPVLRSDFSIFNRLRSIPSNPYRSSRIWKSAKRFSNPFLDEPNIPKNLTLGLSSMKPRDSRSKSLGKCASLGTNLPKHERCLRSSSERY
jgi:hypothetical protein